MVVDALRIAGVRVVLNSVVVPDGVVVADDIIPIDKSAEAVVTVPLKNENAYTDIV